MKGCIDNVGGKTATQRFLILYRYDEEENALHANITSFAQINQIPCRTSKRPLIEEAL